MPPNPRPQSSSRKQLSSPSPPTQLKWLVNTGERLQTSDNRVVEIWELQHQNDNVILSAWAKHLRNQYCSDDQIDLLRRGYSYSRSDYLTKIKFPDASAPPGPSIRAGDFAEILVADYVEFLLKYWVPRTRYNNKTIRNESTKGSDIIGFKFVEKGKDPRKDALMILEAKADFAGKGQCTRLQDAINDSIKDPTRKAESLNAIKQRLLDTQRSAEADKIERFQNPVDHPYQEYYGAVALLSTSRFNRTSIAQTNASAHPITTGLMLLIIHGGEMMTLVHELYRRAANEA